MISVIDVKLAVMKAAFGLQAEDEAKFLRRLESIYLEGYAQGAKDTRELLGIKESAPQHGDES